MKKAIKTLLGIGVFVIAAVLIALAYALFAVDPNAYKPRIESVAANQGIDLEIRGDLEWQLFPNLAIRMGQTRLESERLGIPAAAFERTDLVLSWTALLRRQIAVNALEIHGADLTLANAEQGAAIAAAPAASKQSQASGKELGFGLAIERLMLTDSRVTLPGAAGPATLENLNLSSRSVSTAGEAFPVKLAFDYTGPLSEQPVNVVYEGQARLALKGNKLDLENNRLTVSGPLPEPLELSFGLSADGEAGTLSVRNLKGQLGPAAFGGELSARDITGNLAFSGSVRVPAFDLKSLANQWFQAELVTANPKALSAVGFSTEFAGTTDNVSLDNLQLRLDATTFDGNLRFGLGTPRTLAMTLAGESLRVDDYLAPSDGQKPTNGEQAAATLFAPLAAPLALLEGGTGRIDLSLKALNYEKTRVQNLSAVISAKGQALSVKPLKGQVFGGDFDMEVDLNLATRVPTLGFAAKVQKLALEPALAQFADSVDFTGTLTLDAQGETRGTDTDALAKNLSARGNFRVEEPALTTINVEKAYCEVAALVEKREKRTTPWPAGTRLNTLVGNFRIDDGVVRLENYNTGVGNLKLRGDGRIDLNQEAFNILVVSNLQAERTSEDGCIVKSTRIRNRDIPIRCQDTFAQAGGGSCKPDQAFVNQVIQKEVLDKIQEKTNLDESGSKALEELLRGFLGGGEKRE